MSARRRHRAGRAGTTVTFLLLAATLLLPLSSASPGRSGTSVAPSATVDTLNVATTSALGYDPSTLTVHPGDEVELIVTQMANFVHTFVLSPLPNFTFDAQASAANLSAFFSAHPPLVNLTLAATIGSKAFANFTAPPVGSYEFVCIQPLHFQSGMHGELVSTTSTTSPSNGPPVAVLIGAGALVGIVLVVAVVLLVRRKRPSPPTAP